MSKEEPIWKIQGFKSEYEYLTHLAKEEGFRSLEHKYGEMLAKQKGFESEAEIKREALERMGFKSYADYQDYLARKRGFKNYYDYRKHQLEKKGFVSHKEYYEHVAKLKGYSSYTDYYKYLRLRHLAIRKGFPTYDKYQEHLAKIDESIKLKKEEIKKKEVCKFLEERIVENVDPESLFAKGNIDFLKKIITLDKDLSCNIPLEKKKKSAKI